MGQLRRLGTELRGLTLGRVGRQLRELKQHRRLRSWERRAGGRVPCRFLQSQIFISIGGDLAPCPMPGRPVAGNLMEEDFESIWNGPVLTRMREGFLRGEPEPCCQRCSQNPALHQPGSPETVRQELPEAW